MNDLKLQREVMDELKWEPSIHAAEVGVSAKDGVVTLSGVVDSYAEKLSCERAAKRVRGVRGVAEEIEVRIPLALKRSDSDIARAAVEALSWNAVVPADQVRVEVENGRLRLTGELAWSYQKEAAGDAVRRLTGVRSVENLIEVKPGARQKNVNAEIRRALHRSADLDAKHIHVSTADGTVTLSGSVQSWLAREEAARAAWAAPGVTRVNDHLTVV